MLPTLSNFSLQFQKPINLEVPTLHFMYLRSNHSQLSWNYACLKHKHFTVWQYSNHACNKKNKISDMPLWYNEHHRCYHQATPNAATSTSPINPSRQDSSQKTNLLLTNQGNNKIEPQQHFPLPVRLFVPRRKLLINHPHLPGAGTRLTHSSGGTHAISRPTSLNKGMENRFKCRKIRSTVCLHFKDWHFSKCIVK